MKICSRCKEQKQLELFPKHKGGKFGRKSICKECASFSSKEWHQKNKEKINKRHRERYQEDKEQILQRTKAYALLHKEERKINHREYVKYKRRVDINTKLAELLRSRLRSAVKNESKRGSAVADLMMSISNFKVYLEERFYSNPDTGEMMSWDNHGLKGWHIDHIVPLSFFDLTDRAQFLKACHFSNLQPLWANENLIKSDKITIKENLLCL